MPFFLSFLMRQERIGYRVASVEKEGSAESGEGSIVRQRAEARLIATDHRVQLCHKNQSDSP
jgi:hypothetical protein